MYQRINIDIFLTRVYPLRRHINFEDVKYINIPLVWSKTERGGEEKDEREVKPFREVESIIIS